jgi:hypothetical protein
MTVNGRSVFNFLIGLVAVLVLVGIGVEIYQAGIAQGIVEAGRYPAGAAVPAAGYGYHGFGFGFLGLLFPILFLFLIFGLVRAAFGRGRGWGRGYGWGPGWKGYGPMGGPEAWREERDRQISDLHRRLHETEDSGGSPPR